jgi:hypothetical protein
VRELKNTYEEIRSQTLKRGDVCFDLIRLRKEIFSASNGLFQPKNKACANEFWHFIWDRIKKKEGK